MAGELRVNLFLNTDEAKAAAADAAKSIGGSFSGLAKSNPMLKMMLEFEQALSRGEARVNRFRNNFESSFAKLKANSASASGELQKAIGSSGIKVHIAGENPNAAANRAAYEASRNVQMSGSGLASAAPADVLSGKKRTKEEQIKYDAAEARRFDQLQSDSAKAFKSKTMFYKDLTFLFQPLLNPTSVWGNMFAARQTFSAFSTEEGQRRIGGGGAGGALKATVALQGMALAIGFAIKGLKMLGEEAIKAIQFSHALYGKSLSSGLSLGFTANRQMAADVLGVSETDVIRFKQGQQVMKQLAGAVGEISKNAPTLAYVSSQFKIIQYDFLALGSKIATEVAPAIIGLAKSLEFLLAHIKEMMMVVTLPYGAAKALGLDFNKLLKITSPLYGLMSLIGSKDIEKNGFKQPMGFMKQLSAGAFEKMGLIIGGGQADKALEYQRRTATTLEKIYQAGQQAMKKTGHYMNRNPNVAGY